MPRYGWVTKSLSLSLILYMSCGSHQTYSRQSIKIRCCRLWGFKMAETKLGLDTITNQHGKKKHNLVIVRYPISSLGTQFKKINILGYPISGLETQFLWSRQVSAIRRSFTQRRIRTNLHGVHGAMTFVWLLTSLNLSVNFWCTSVRLKVQRCPQDLTDVASFSSSPTINHPFFCGYLPTTGGCPPTLDPRFVGL